MPNVHIIGDSVLSNLPKSGHMATNHAKVCAAAIVELLAGRQPDPIPVIANTCYSATSDTTAGYVANVYRFEAGKGYVSQPEGGATGKGDDLNFAYAESWAQNIWAEYAGLIGSLHPIHKRGFGPVCLASVGGARFELVPLSG